MAYPRYIKMAEAEAAKIDPLLNVSIMRSDSMTGSKTSTTQREENMAQGLVASRGEHGSEGEDTDETSDRKGVSEASGGGGGTKISSYSDNVEMSGGETVQRVKDSSMGDPETMDTERWEGYQEVEYGGESRTESGGETRDGRRVEKAMPQSMTYGNAAAGEIPVLEWGAPSGQAQEEGSSSRTANLVGSNNRTKMIDGAHVTERAHVGDREEAAVDTENRAYDNRKDNKSGGSSETSSERSNSAGTDQEAADVIRSRQLDRETLEERDEQINRDIAGSEQESESSSKTGSGSEYGFRGDQSEAYRKYYDFISGTNALKWFIESLAPCFALALDEEEEHEPERWGW